MFSIKTLRKQTYTKRLDWDNRMTEQKYALFLKMLEAIYHAMP
jgi:N-acyl-L-homoserine lactone synthetase